MLAAGPGESGVVLSMQSDLSTPQSAGLSQGPCLAATTCSPASIAQPKCLSMATTIVVSLADAAYPLEHFCILPVCTHVQPSHIDVHSLIASPCPHLTGIHAHRGPPLPCQSTFARSSSQVLLPTDWKHLKCSSTACALISRGPRTKLWACSQPSWVRTPSPGVMS